MKFLFLSVMFFFYSSVFAGLFSNSALKEQCLYDCEQSSADFQRLCQIGKMAACAMIYRCDSDCEELSGDEQIICEIIRAVNCGQNALDPSRPMVHGNYCGVGSASSRAEQRGEKISVYNTKIVDALDRLCFEHDTCYGKGDEFQQACDMIFVLDLARLKKELSDNIKKNSRATSENIQRQKLIKKINAMIVYFGPIKGAGTLVQGLFELVNEL